MEKKIEKKKKKFKDKLRETLRKKLKLKQSPCRSGGKMISAEERYSKKRVDVLGKCMVYVE